MSLTLLVASQDAPTIHQTKCDFVQPITPDNKCKVNCVDHVYQSGKCYDRSEALGTPFSVKFDCLPDPGPFPSKALGGPVNESAWPTSDCTGEPLSSCMEHVGWKNNNTACFGGTGPFKQKAEMLTKCSNWAPWPPAPPAAFDAVSRLDLERLAPKMVSDGWFKDAAAAHTAVEEYRKFLHVKREDRGESGWAHPMAPSPLVDLAWHAHLLDTRAYMRDCDALFGEYLHHAPTYDLAAEKDEMRTAYERTLRAYRAAFGEPDPAVWPSPAATDASCLTPTCC